MQVVQMTLEEALVAEVDEEVRRTGTTRSAFARAALREALARRRTVEAEERQRRGYDLHPIRPGEFDDWIEEQAWADR